MGSLLRGNRTSVVLVSHGHIGVNSWRVRHGLQGAAGHTVGKQQEYVIGVI
jgi:hypothetical protein